MAEPIIPLKVYDPNGVEIPEDQISTHLSQGTARFQKDSIVPMMAPDGTIWKVPSQSAQEALDSGEGWLPASVETQRARALHEAAEEHPILAGIAAGATQAADVGTFGQTSVARAVVAPQMARDIEVLKEEMPVSTAIGTVGGALIGGGAGGATGRAVKGLAELTGAAKFIPGLDTLVTGAAGETGLLTRAGASATKYGVTGAAESGFYSAAEETARQVRGLGPDHSLSVEKILAAGGEGAAIGGAFGGILGGAGRMSVDVAAAHMSPNILALKAAGMTQAQIKTIVKNNPPEIVDSIVRTIKEEPGIIKPFNTVKESAEAAVAARERVGKQIGSLIKQIDETGYKPDTTKIKADVQELIDGLRAKNIKADTKIARKLEDWQTDLESKTTLSDLHGFRQRFDNEIQAVWNKKKDKAIDTAYKKFRGILETGTDGKGGIEGIVDDAVNRAALAGDTPLATNYLALKQKYFGLNKAATDLKESAAATAVKDALGTGDLLRVGIGTGTAALHGLGGLMSAGVGLATDLAWRAVKSRNTAALLVRAAESVKGGVDATTGKIANSVGQTLTTGASQLVQKVPTATGKIITRYQQSSDTAQQIRANPELAVSKAAQVVRPLTVLDPNLGRAAGKTVADDLKWLSDKLPPPGTNSVFSTKAMGLGASGGKGKKGKGKEKGIDTLANTATPARVSITAASKFTRAESALRDPVGALKNVNSKGILGPETAEVFQVRRPALQEQVRNEMGAKIADMAERGLKPSRVSRIQMSLISGAPLDSTMEPAFIKSVQGFWAKEREKVAQAPQTPPRRETSKRTRDRARSQLSAGDAVEDDSGEIG